MSEKKEIKEGNLFLKKGIIDENFF